MANKVITFKEGADFIFPRTPLNAIIYNDGDIISLMSYLDDFIKNPPVASSSTLGFIKVGAGLQIGPTGILSVHSGGAADSVEWSGVLSKPLINSKGLESGNNSLDYLGIQPKGDYALKSELFSKNYEDLNNKPNLSVYATTNSVNSSLEAKQNKISSSLTTQSKEIEGAINELNSKVYVPEIATSTTIGGIKASPKTVNETVQVKIDGNGFLFVPTIAGPKGDKGETGSNGTNGEDGTKWFSDNFGSSSTVNKTITGSTIGDYAYDISGNNYIYKQTSLNTWTRQSTYLKGNTGYTGSSGSNGYTWIPSVDSSGNISWTSTQSGSGSTPTTRNIMGPAGRDGVDAVFNANQSYTLAGSNTFTASNFILTSDRRLKSHIESLTTNYLSEIKAKSFILEGKNRFGYIAQDIEKIDKSFVSEFSREGKTYKALSYLDIHTVLIEELKRENINLKSTITSLIKRLEAIENKLNKE